MGFRAKIYMFLINQYPIFWCQNSPMSPAFGHVESQGFSRCFEYEGAWKMDKSIFWVTIQSISFWSTVYEVPAFEKMSALKFLVVNSQKFPRGSLSSKNLGKIAKWLFLLTIGCDIRSESADRKFFSVEMCVRVHMAFGLSSAPSLTHTHIQIP